MKILTVANQKGGVGKTAFLINYAHYLARLNKRVLIIDLDTQANASYTLQDYKINNIVSSNLLSSPFEESIQYDNNINIIQADNKLVDIDSMNLNNVINNFQISLNNLYKNIDYILIDTAPAFNNRLYAAIINSTHIISPVELEAYSLLGIKLMITAINNSKKNNPNINFLGILASRVNTTNPRQLNHLEELKAAYGDLVIPGYIGSRNAIADAITFKEDIYENKKSSARKAKQELKAVCDFIYNKMEQEDE